VQVGPRSFLPYSRDKAHRHAVLFCECSTCSMPGRRCEDFSDLRLCELRRASLFANSTSPNRAGFPMRQPAPYALWILSCPMVIATAEALQFLGRPRTSANTAILYGIGHILRWRSPIKVVWRVAALVIVTMRAMIRWIWARAIERRADQIVHRTVYAPAINRKSVARISSAAGRAKDEALILALPIRVTPSNAADAGNLIIGRFCNHAPLLGRATAPNVKDTHMMLTPSFGQGRALLQAALPARFCSRIRDCSQ